MKSKTLSVIAAVFALGSVTSVAMAQDDGLPDNPSSSANTIPAPDASEPSDPAANDNPAARVPTAPNERLEMGREGYNRGTSGSGGGYDSDAD
jgi:hypothetical protein